MNENCASFSHNPYDAVSPLLFHEDGEYGSLAGSIGSRSNRSTPPPPPLCTASAAMIAEEEEPRITHHHHLIEKVSFIPYPIGFFDSTCMATNSEPLKVAVKTNMCRLFLGQLPYDVFEGQVQWVVSHLTGGLEVHGMERIVRWKNNRQPSGCVHVYCRHEDAQAITGAINNRILFDDSGLWLASNDEELAVLSSYCATLKQCRELRPFQRPYQMMSAEAAKSNYIPRSRQVRVVQRDAEFNISAGSFAAAAGYPDPCAPAGLYGFRKQMINDASCRCTNYYDNYGPLSTEGMSVLW